MKRSILLSGAFVLDAIAGDPEWLPHPVRVMGWIVERGEAQLRRCGGSAKRDLVAGALLTAAVVGGSYAVSALTVAQVRRRSAICADAMELLFAWTTLAARNLCDEAEAVIRPLSQDDLPAARLRLRRIVGRDTEDLGREEISRAVIETVAESTSDGIIAPMFYLALGGVPLAMAYKAVNTMDSMIGHADARYFFFGKAAARLDDLANLLPSRLTAAAIVASAALTKNDGWMALRTWAADGGKHKSPNAGQPESAVAGALQVRLGGSNRYAGEVVTTPEMGATFGSPGVADAARSVRLARVAAYLVLTAAVIFTVHKKTTARRS